MVWGWSLVAVFFLLSGFPNFILNIFKYTDKVVDLYGEHSETHHLDSPINIFLYLLSHPMQLYPPFIQLMVDAFQSTLHLFFSVLYSCISSPWEAKPLPHHQEGPLQCTTLGLDTCVCGPPTSSGYCLSRLWCQACLYQDWTECFLLDSNTESSPNLFTLKHGIATLSMTYRFFFSFP